MTLLWPQYFDKGLTRKMGRRLPANLAVEKPHVKDLFKAAQKDGKRLKYVAEFNANSARVKLEAIPPGHDFFNLRGSDNIVLFYTDRYPEQPLMIKGAGAGAEVTASGLFADIIRAGTF